MPTAVLTVAAVCFFDAVGRVLTVRKRGTDAFMLPGGKLEPGESPRAAAVREVGEELGVILTESDVRHLISWRGPAANEPHTDIESTVFETDVVVDPSPEAEIEEVRWIDLDNSESAPIAPMLELFLLAELRQRRE